LDLSVEGFLKSKGAITVGDTRLIDALKAENAHFQAALNMPAAGPPQTAHGDYKLKQSYNKLQKEFQEFRVQSAEALTSLKILEDENEELPQELGRLKNQSKNTAATKAG